MKTTKTFTIDKDIWNDFNKISSDLSLNNSQVIENYLKEIINNPELCLAPHKKKQENIMKDFKFDDISKERAIKKWGPVMDCLNITDEGIKNIMCIFAEQHQLISNLHFSSDDNIKISSLLPTSLKLLSLIDFKNKNLEITSDPSIVNTYSITVPIEKNNLNYIKSEEDGRHFIYNVEDDLIDKIRNLIQNELEKYNTLIIYLPISKIDLSVDNDGMTLQSKISFKN